MTAGAGSSGRFDDRSAGVGVRDVVRDVVTAVAPEELVVLDGLAGFDDDTVVRRFGQGGRREPLGFGWDELTVLVTPVVWLVLDQAAKKAAGTAVDGAAKGTKTLLRKVFRKKPAAVAVLAPLTDDQLDQVRQQVLDSAVQRGLAPERAEEIADAVMARLWRATRRPSGSDSGDTPTQG